MLYDRIFRYSSFRASMASRWPLYAGLLSTWTILAVLQSTGPRMYSAGFSSGVSPWTYLLNQTRMIARYLRLAVWPDALVLNYGEPLNLALADVWPQAVLVVLLAVLSAFALMRRPAIGFAGAWFFITLAPTSSIVPIATEVGAERRMYLPLIALTVIAAAAGLWLAQELYARVRPDPGPDRGGQGQAVPTTAVAALVLVIGTFAAATMHRNQEYLSPLVLAETSYERWPTPVAHHMVATELSLAGREDEALRGLRESVKGYPRGHYDLGITLFRKKEYAEAIRSFDAFVSQYPLLLEVVEARALTGRAHFALQQWPEAIAAFEDALRKLPSRVDIHGALADTLVKAQRPADAIPHYRRYLAAFPRDTSALGSLAVLLVEQDELPEAIDLLKRAVETDPGSAAARRNLAGALFASGDVAVGLEHARRAAALAPGDPLVFDLLGLGLVSDGQTAEAVRAFEQAARLAPDDPEIREHLAAALAMTRGPGPPAGTRQP
jgi:tetratricopeptide (TPR) repeat protein